MDIVPMWLVARGSTKATVWIGIRDFPSWPPQARSRFNLEFGKPVLFEPTFTSVQVLEVDTTLALTISWDVLCGVRSKVAVGDASILELLPSFEESFYWGDDEEDDNSSVDTS